MVGSDAVRGQYLDVESFDFRLCIIKHILNCVVGLSDDAAVDFGARAIEDGGEGGDKVDVHFVDMLHIALGFEFFDLRGLVYDLAP